ncbi:MAG: DUF6580 family putative transport protein [Phycisphaerae bacterium]
MRNVRASHIGVVAVLLTLGIAGRLLPHPPGVTPVAACALFAGFFFARALWAVLIPLTALFVSDLVLGGYALPTMLVVYAALSLPVWLRMFLKNRPTAVRVGLCSLAMSAFFFLSTNLAVWAFSGMYVKTLGGLGQCFAAAVPFFRYTVIGDLCWSGAIFGAYAIVMAARRKPIGLLVRPNTVA